MVTQRGIEPEFFVSVKPDALFFKQPTNLQVSLTCNVFKIIDIDSHRPVGRAVTRSSVEREV